MMDYEAAAHKGFLEVYPDVHLSGCYFHLKQSVLRKVAELGLRQKYREEEEFNVQVKMMTALAFVPPEDVATTFEALSDAFPDEESTDCLLDYFKSTYIEGPVVRRRQRPPKFPIDMWNHFTDATEKASKTTNCTEGWHNALHALFQSSHPGVWKLFDGLRKDIAIQKLVIVKSDTAGEERPKLQYTKLAERLQSKVEMYHQEEDKMKYLRSIAYMT